MSGGLPAPLSVVGLAMFGVWSEVLSTVGLDLFVSVALSTVVFEAVATMRFGSGTGSYQPARWYRLSGRTHTCEYHTAVRQRYERVG